MKADARFEKAVNHVLEIEGGFADHPADYGGPTNMGITLPTLRAINKGASVADLKKLTPEQAAEIYRVLYWDKYSCGMFAHPVGEKLFDWVVNMSPRTAGILFQEAINISNPGRPPLKEDGIIGQKTLDAGVCTDPRVLRAAMVATQIGYYRTRAAKVPSQEVFLAGWINRAKKVW